MGQDRVLFYAAKRADGGIQNFDAITVMKCAAFKPHLDFGDGAGRHALPAPLDLIFRSASRLCARSSEGVDDGRGVTGADGGSLHRAIQ